MIVNAHEDVLNCCTFMDDLGWFATGGNNVVKVWKLNE